eukprot:TRINITY_DN8114_c0_g1_i1.p1 TRINITY_DN8114_c0_g1~~TRINITY_DN8114_c0_g1_i1.p1  ORF type:complete len:134 (+),score=32.24 TRINITY_DN8114_c0_g1_i1:195-596(+)
MAFVQETTTLRTEVEADDFMSRMKTKFSKIESSKLLVCYVAIVFSCRLLLRSKYAHSLPHVAIMALEDGMSMLSFAVGLLYLHRSNGAPLALLAKCVSSDAEEFDFDASGSALATTGASATAAQRIRLFSVAL